MIFFWPIRESFSLTSFFSAKDANKLSKTAYVTNSLLNILKKQI